MDKDELHEPVWMVEGNIRSPHVRRGIGDCSTQLNSDYNQPI